MGRILERGVMDATVVELVLAVAAGFALFNFLQPIGWRLFATERFGMAGIAIPSGQILAPLFVFAVLAVLLAAIVYVRLQAEDALWREIEEEEALEAEPE